MKRPSNYNTKQREAIVAYIASLGDTHTTAAQIVEHFKSGAIIIGRTTVYRHLDRLVKNGRVRKYMINGISGACFQYSNNGHNCHIHLHLKCEDCGVLFHLRCDTFNGIQEHILNKHDFQVNAAKTVLYGKCENCRI